MNSKIYYRVVYSLAEYSGLYETKEIEFSNRQRLLELWESLAAICAFCLESGVRICTAIAMANSDISEDAFEQALTKNRERVDLRKLGYMNEPVQYVQTEAFLKLYNWYSDHPAPDKLCGTLDAAYIWEFIWELARREVKPTAASRINSVYLWESEERAEKFKDEHRKHPSYKIVRVKVEDEDKVQVYDAKWLDAVPTDATLEEAYVYAVRYWLGVESESPCWEILYEGRYEIIE